MLRKNPKKKFIFIAHSLGSYISLNVIHKYKDIENAVLKGYYLYPGGVHGGITSVF